MRFYLSYAAPFSRMKTRPLLDAARSWTTPGSNGRREWRWRARLAVLAAGFLAPAAFGQTALTWEQIVAKFKAGNPTLLAAQLNIDESRDAEITAYLRPNPEFSLSADGFQLTPNQGICRPLSGVVETPGLSYLHERRHKRELRLEGAKLSTADRLFDL